jgi:hypothetical protein
MVPFKSLAVSGLTWATVHYIIKAITALMMEATSTSGTTVNF